MPSNENTNPATAPEPENYGLPENFVPIDVPPIIPANVVPNAGPAVNPYKSGTLNPNLSFQQDLVNAGSYGPGVPSTRLMPIGAAGNAQSNAAIKTIVDQAIAEIPPAEVVTINVGDVNQQTAAYAAAASDSGKLISFNITSKETLTLPSTPPSDNWTIAVENNGSAMLTISPNGPDLDYQNNSIVLGPGQGVQIFTDGSNYFTQRGLGDGLIHGSTPTEIDPSYSFWRDDFVFGSTTAFGELGWGNTTGSGATVQRLQGAYPNVGLELISSGTTTTTFSSAYLPFSATSTGAAGNQITALPLLDYPGWKMVWVFGWPSKRTIGSASNFPLAKKQFYCGLSTVVNSASSDTWSPANAVNARPQYFIGLRFDTDTTAPAISDTTFHFEVVANANFGQTRNNTQGTVVDTGMTPTEYTWYRFEMLCTVAGQIQMTLTGGGSTFNSTLSPSQITSVGGTGGLSITLARGNGLGEMNQASPATSITNGFTMAVGSKVTISGATNSFYDGTVTLFSCVTNSTAFLFSLAGGSNTEAGSPATLTYFPGLVPYIGFGNDTQATPANVDLGIDFFSLVLSQGLAGVSQVPNNSRYY